MGDTGVLLPRTCPEVVGGLRHLKPFLVSGQEVTGWPNMPAGAGITCCRGTLRRLADIEIIHGKATAVDSEGRSVTVIREQRSGGLGLSGYRHRRGQRILARR